MVDKMNLNHLLEKKTFKDLSFNFNYLKFSCKFKGK